MRIIRLLTPLLICPLLSVGLALPAVAEEGNGKILERLAKIMPNAKPDRVEKAAVPGLYEVVYGPKLVYMTEDGRYLVDASIVDLENDQNLTDPQRAKAVQASLDKVGENNMVIFGDKAKLKHTITVFTDIDCGYCRKLHSEISEYNKAGIRVRYVFYPRAGLASESFAKAVSVWCASDRNKAMTTAKTGGSVESKNCDNPVMSHMQLGEMMGINGTPAIVLASGEVLPGYIPAKKLGEYLDKQSQ